MLAPSFVSKLSVTFAGLFIATSLLTAHSLAESRPYLIVDGPLREFLSESPPYSQNARYWNVSFREGDSSFLPRYFSAYEFFDFETMEAVTNFLPGGITLRTLDLLPDRTRMLAIDPDGTLYTLWGEGQSEYARFKAATEVKAAQFLADARHAAVIGRPLGGVDRALFIVDTVTLETTQIFKEAHVSGLFADDSSDRILLYTGSYTRSPQKFVLYRPLSGEIEFETELPAGVAMLDGLLIPSGDVFIYLRTITTVFPDGQPTLTGHRFAGLDLISGALLSFPEASAEYDGRSYFSETGRYRVDTSVLGDVAAVVDLRSGEQVMRLELGSDPRYRNLFLFSSDGLSLLVVNNGEKRVEKWGIKEQTLLDRSEPLASPVTITSKLSENGSLALVTAYSEFVLLGGRLQTLATLDLPERDYRALALSAGAGRAAALARDLTVSIATGPDIHYRAKERFSHGDIYLAKDQRELVMLQRMGDAYPSGLYVRRIDIESGITISLSPLPGHQEEPPFVGSPHAVVAEESGRIFVQGVGQWDNSARNWVRAIELFDSTTGDLLWAYSGVVHAFATDPEGELWAGVAARNRIGTGTVYLGSGTDDSALSGSSLEVVVYETLANKQTYTNQFYLEAERGDPHVLDIAMSPNGRYVAVGAGHANNGRFMVLFDREAGTESSPVAIEGIEALDLHYTEDSSTLYAVGSSAIVQIDIGSAGVTETVPLESRGNTLNYAYSLADQRLFLTSSDGYLEIVDLGTGRLLGQKRIRPGGDAAFEPRVLLHNSTSDTFLIANETGSIAEWRTIDAVASSLKIHRDNDGRDIVLRTEGTASPKVRILETSKDLRVWDQSLLPTSELHKRVPIPASTESNGAIFFRARESLSQKAQ